MFAEEPDARGDDAGRGETGDRTLGRTATRTLGRTGDRTLGLARAERWVRAIDPPIREVDAAWQRHARDP